MLCIKQMPVGSQAMRYTSSQQVKSNQVTLKVHVGNIVYDHKREYPRLKRQ